MTLEDYYAIPDDTRPDMDRWIEEAVGLPLKDALVVEVELGEGHITCLRYKQENGRVAIVGDEPVRFTSTHAVRSLPPCWPPCRSLLNERDYHRENRGAKP